MASFEQVLTSWNRHLHGVSRSKDRTYFTDYGLWYDRDVVFYRYLPVIRAVPMPSGEFVYLVRCGVNDSSWNWAKILREGLKEQRVIHFTNCIGVFSTKRGDRVDGQLLLERMRHMIMHQLEDRLDRVHEEDFEGEGRIMLAGRESHALLTFQRLIDNAYMAWDGLRIAFDLHWGPMPDYAPIYRDKFRTALDAYMDPKAVEKRERATARRVAKKAFGLDEAA